MSIVNDERPADGGPAPPVWIKITASFALAFLLADFFFMARLGFWKEHSVAFLRLYGAAYAAYLILTAMIWRGGLERRGFFYAGLAVALFMRVACWTTPVSLSTDVYRYMWDGKTAAAGVNPYRHAPNDPALAHLRNPDYHDEINHPDLKTIYPPAAQLQFEALHRLFGDTASGFRAGAFLIELCILLLSIQLLKAMGIPTVRSLIYALNPAAAVEFAHGAHGDGLMMAFLLAAFLWAFHRPRPAACGAALALAVASKYAAAVCLPALLAATGIFREKWKGSGVLLASFPIVLAAVFWRHRDAGPGIFESLADFQTWPAAAWSPADLLQQLAPGMPLFGTAALALLALLAGIAILRNKKAGLLTAAWGFICLLAASALLNPIQRPWYFLWPLPWLSAAPSIALLALPGLKAAIYWRFAEGAPNVEEISRIQYAVFYALASLELGAWGAGWVKRMKNNSGKANRNPGGRGPERRRKPE